MTTTALGSSRGAPHGDVTVGPAGPIVPDVFLIFEDVLTREEVIVEIEKIKSRLIEIDFPRV